MVPFGKNTEKGIHGNINYRVGPSLTFKHCDLTQLHTIGLCRMDLLGLVPPTTAAAVAVARRLLLSTIGTPIVPLAAAAVATAKLLL